VEPGLDGLLLFDLPSAALPAVASSLIEALTAGGSALAPPRLVRLGSHEEEDDLWSSLRPQTSDGVTTLIPLPGPLVRQDDDPILVVVVPDLARLSLAASRAAITMLGSPTAELQRHGRSQRWSTGTYWVAACATADVGQVSEHLLDRFPVRLPARSLAPNVDPVQRIMRALADAPEEPQVPVPALPPAWRSVLQRGQGGLPVDDSAIERAVALHNARHGMRRPLALLRLARATARLAGDPAVTADHIDDIAVLTTMTESVPSPTPSVAVTGPTEPQAEYDRDRPAAPRQDLVERTGTAVVEPVLMAAPAEALPELTVTALMPQAYPEDGADPEREAEPLKLPWQRAAGRPTDRGPIVGTMPARSLEDIA